MWWKLIDGNLTYQPPPAYCQYKKGYLSANQMRIHQCNRKQCPMQQRFEGHSYWKERAKRKQHKKDGNEGMA